MSDNMYYDKIGSHEIERKYKLGISTTIKAEEQEEFKLYEDSSL